jgi:hypothetical protein
LLVGLLVLLTLVYFYGGAQLAHTVVEKLK